jgi:hypothetical protein
VIALTPNTMRRIVALLLISAALILVRRSFLSEQSLASLEGIVLDATTDRPLQNVQVTITPGNTVAYTDSEGHFKATDIVPSGLYRVLPTLDGFVYERPERLNALREPGAWIQQSKTFNCAC